ncbi:MAG TPA: RES domain-containing protein [Solirubrobacterales bacterium]|nr:RES domain-containing protein [Solirubrobacterales bacterium]
MRLWRALPLDERSIHDQPGGALWFPREQQGAGRHDNPELYGCLYVASDPVSAVAEQLAPFRGSGTLVPSMLIRFGLPLALAALELNDDVPVVDLDDPQVLDAEGLRPSRVATRLRSATQLQAAEIYAAHGDAMAIRWWSTLEASWINWTIFGRAAPALDLTETALLDVGNGVVREAADLLGLASA